MDVGKLLNHGIKPASLAKVKDPAVRAFIEKCIAQASDRLSAKELLMDRFLQSDDDNGSIGRHLQSSPHHADDNHDQFGNGKAPEDSIHEGNRDFTVQGQMKDLNTIFLKLRITDSTGHIRNIHFPFDIDADTSTAVASEMVEELDLTDQDVSDIAALIDSEIRSYIPDWAPRELSGDHIGTEVAVSDSCASEAHDDASPSNDSTRSGSSLLLERLPSGRKYWCDSPKDGGGSSPHRLEECLHEDNVKERAASSGGGLQFGASNLNSGKGHHLLGGNNKISREIGSDDVKIIVGRLEHLLVEQQRELDELRRKHHATVSNILKELTPEIRCKVVSTCNMEISDYKKADNSTDPGS